MKQLTNHPAAKPCDCDICAYSRLITAIKARGDVPEMRRMIEELSESLWNANEELSMLQHESAALGANARQPTAPQSPEERQHKTKRDLNLDPCEECEQPKAITADRLLELLEARVFPGSHIDIWHEGEHSWTIIGGDKRLVFTGSSLFEALRKAVGGDAA